jgi:hypothetical protein
VTAPAAEHGVNVPLLQQVLDHITDQPARWDQGVWCGTACCLAGHAAQLSGWEPVPGVDDPLVRKGKRVAPVPTVARNLLGLSGREGDLLFDGSNKLRDLWNLAAAFTEGQIQLSDGQDERVAEIDADNRAW